MKDGESEVNLGTLKTLSQKLKEESYAVFQVNEILNRVCVQSLYNKEMAVLGCAAYPLTWLHPVHTLLN